MNTASVIAPSFIHSSIKRRRNTWYSINDGNWSDPLTWQSNASKRYAYPGQNTNTPIFPAVGDDVYIGHVVTLDTSFTVTYVNNLFVSGTLKTDSNPRSLHIYGDIKATGIIDCTSSNTIDIILYGVNNYINTYNKGTVGKVTYARIGDQVIMDLSYHHFTLAGAGVKYATNNVSLSGNLVSPGFNTPGVYNNQLTSIIFELSAYNLSVTGTSSITGAILSKNSAGSILFIGNLNVNSGGLSFIGNPTVEIRGGIALITNLFNSGTGKWSFTTNNQSVNLQVGPSGIINMLGNVEITGNITVTNESSNTALVINTQLEGTVVGSTFINKGRVYINSINTTPMNTGVFDRLTYNTNYVGYIYNGNITIPYTTYQNLFISGTGIKTLSGNTVCSTNFVGIGIFGTWQLECSSYSFTTQGTTGSQQISTGIITKNSLTGAISFGATCSFGSFIFNSSNSPQIEFKNGFSLDGATWVLNSGSVISFTTNNQSLALAGSLDLGSASILISGAITLTISGSGSLVISNTINGNNAASTLDNRSTAFYQNAVQPMLTGILQCNAAANNFKYNMLGNQNVVGGTYRTIEFGGSGIKTLQGNIVVNVTAGGSQLTTGTATINLNGFSITTI